LKSSIFVDVRSSNGSYLCVIERRQSLIGSILVDVCQVLDSEVGDLLPRNYKFCRQGIPISAKQEESLMLQSRVQAVELENVVDDTCADSNDYSLEIKEVTIQNSESTSSLVSLLQQYQDLLRLCKNVIVSVGKEGE